MIKLLIIKPSIQAADKGNKISVAVFVGPQSNFNACNAQVWSYYSIYKKSIDSTLSNQEKLITNLLLYYLMLDRYLLAI